MEHDAQTEEYWCGPACINIVLSRWDQQQSQPNLWAKVQANTGMNALPAGAPANTQRCDSCSASDHECWFTHPDVMPTTINAYSPQTLRVDYLGSHDAIRRIADSIVGDVAAVFTTQPSLHWIVAIGYQLDGVGAAISWNNRNLTGLYVLNPSVPTDNDTIHLTTVDGLEGIKPASVDGLLMATRCGQHANLYPVVHKGTPDGTTTPVTGSLTARMAAYLKIVTPKDWWYKVWRWARMMAGRRGPFPR